MKAILSMTAVAHAGVECEDIFSWELRQAAGRIHVARPNAARLGREGFVRGSLALW